MKWFFLFLCLLAPSSAKEWHRYIESKSYSFERGAHPDLPPETWIEGEHPAYLPHPIWYRFIWKHPEYSGEVCIKTGNSAHASFFEMYLDGKEVRKTSRPGGSFGVTSYRQFANPQCVSYRAGAELKVLAFTEIHGTFGFFTPVESIAWTFHDTGWLWIYVCFAFSMMVILLILWRAFHSTLFAYYMLFCFFFNLVGMSYTNMIHLLGPFFSSHHGLVSEIAKFGTFLTLTLFTNRYFKLRKRAPVFFYYLLLFCLYPLSSLVYSLSTQKANDYTPDSGVFALFLFSQVLIGVYFAVKKVPWAKGFVFSWGFFFLGVASLAISQLTGSFSVWRVNYVPAIGHMLEMCCFTLVISLRALTRIQKAAKEVNKTSELKENLVRKCSVFLKMPLATLKYLSEVQMIWKVNSKDEITLYEHSMMRLQKNLLNLEVYSASQAFERGPVNVGEVTGKCWERIQKVYPEVDLRYRIQKNNIVHIDGKALEILVQNLMDNSCKFSKVNSASFRVDWTEEALVLEFKDDGKGFPAQKLEEFQRDFAQEDSSLTRRFEGLGLGLYLVKKMLKRLNATYELNYLLNGFSFQVSIPVAERMEVSLPIQNKRGIDARVEMESVKQELKKKILVVDDNDINRKMLCKMIEKLGFQAISAVDGKDAIEKFKAFGKDLTMIFMDIQMPVMDGIEATKDLRLEGKYGSLIPIVAITAHGDEEWREKCFASGMNGFMTKPFRKEDIVAELRRLQVLIE